MPKKESMKKKPVEKGKAMEKGKEKEPCTIDEKCRCDIALIKLASMAFILFLVTVWPAVGNWLVGVPWWVYLIITVVLGAIAMKRVYWCNK